MRFMELLFVITRLDCPMNGVFDAPLPTVSTDLLTKMVFVDKALRTGQRPEEVVFEGDAFGRHMVRMITDRQIEVGLIKVHEDGQVEVDMDLRNRDPRELRELIIKDWGLLLMTTQNSFADTNPAGQPS